MYYQEPAKRRSGNRPRGTLVTKTMKVGRDTMRSYMITKLLPAIKAKWPKEDANKTIWIQQDNAPSHVPPNDAKFTAAVRETGLDIHNESASKFPRYELPRSRLLCISSINDR